MDGKLDKFSLGVLTLLHVQCWSRTQNLVKLEEIRVISSKRFWMIFVLYMGMHLEFIHYFLFYFLCMS